MIILKCHTEKPVLQLLLKIKCNLTISTVMKIYDMFVVLLLTYSSKISLRLTESDNLFSLERWISCVVGKKICNI